MGLLEKFDAVKLKADDRISESDRLFCESYQKAYDKAREVLSELKYHWEEIEKTQDDALRELGDERYRNLFIHGPLDISCSTIEGQLEENHKKLIEKVVSHFCSTYHVSVSEHQVKEVLLPAKTSNSGWNRNEEEWRQYHAELQTMALRYEMIVDQVLIQLDGRSFVERAVDELKERCHKAAWNAYQKKPDYELKKDTLRLTRYACKYETWMGQDRWCLQDGAKQILHGIAHFETGGFAFFPLGFSELLGYGNQETPIHEFPTCNKINQLRMFKNGRVDIKFTSELFAKQFTENYLGLVC